VAEECLAVRREGRGAVPIALAGDWLLIALNGLRGENDLPAIARLDEPLPLRCCLRLEVVGEGAEESRRHDFSVGLSSVSMLITVISSWTIDQLGS
jgi:hypothetical protein